jgi:hypothetical protein
VFARQPCDPIPRPRDVGQWLCVPPFRVVCLYQAFTFAVNDACVTRTQQGWYGSGAQPCGLWAPRTRRSTRARSLAVSCPPASVPSAESNPHANVCRRAKIYFGGCSTRAGTRMGSRSEGAKWPRDWAKTAWRGARAAGCHGHRRPFAGRPPAWPSPAADQEACTAAGAPQRPGRRVDCPP